MPKARRECSVVGCDRPHFGRSYCAGHHYRAYISDNFHLPIDPQEPVLAPLLGPYVKRGPRANEGQIVTCRIDGCDTECATSVKLAKETGLPRSYRGMCNAHYKAWQTHGDPFLRRRRDSGGADNVNWRGDEVSYNGAHCRIRRARGSASGYTCVDCSNPAQHWAYNGNDKNALFGRVSRTEFFAFYSADPAFYDPLCPKCHRTRDAEIAQRELRSYRAWRHRTGMTLPDIAVGL